MWFSGIHIWATQTLKNNWLTGWWLGLLLGLKVWTGFKSNPGQRSGLVTPIMAMVCDVGMNIHGSYVNGMNMYELQSTRTLDGFGPYTWGFPKIGVPQIIQVMNDHDSDIETNGDFGSPFEETSTSEYMFHTLIPRSACHRLTNSKHQLKRRAHSASKWWVKTLGPFCSPSI